LRAESGSTPSDARAIWGRYSFDSRNNRCPVCQIAKVVSTSAVSQEIMDRPVTVIKPRECAVTAASSPNRGE
jgi:hypothetical protein